MPSSEAALRAQSSSGKVEVLPSQFYEERLSDVARARKPSPIWDLFSVESNPGMLSMLAGKPHPDTFPFEYIQLGLRPAGSEPNDPTVQDLTIRDDELATALQYNVTPGIPELNQWVFKMMQEVHKRGPNEGWRVSIGPGSQDLLYKAFNAFLNPGDLVMVEGPTYPGATPILEALGCQYVSIETDKDGILASELAKTLENWDPSKPMPKVLYTIPFGSNPSGVTASIERRIEILKLSKKYGFIILEDDPYYFLYYGDSPRPPSYFTLEAQVLGEVGRVLRFDSFSKVLSAGFRIGWLTGPERLLSAIECHSATSVVQASSLSQIVILKLLREWGVEGLLKHADKVAKFYKRRRDVMATCLDRHLKGLAEWSTPDAAMFYWLKLKLPGSVDLKSITLEGDSTVFIRSKAIDRGVLVLPGATAFVDGRQTARVRVSFSLLTEEETDEAIRRLAEVLKEEIHSKSA